MDYKALIRPLMGEKRYNHSCAVAEQARHLAEKWGADPQKAWDAGILHDICKDMPKEEQLKCIRENGIIPSDILMGSKSLWHSLAGSLYLPTVGVTDPEILSAVRYHTSGRPEMSLLEQIVYLADLTSSDRDYPDAARMRELCELSLDKATFAAMQFIIGDLASRAKLIGETTWSAYNYYLAKVTEE